MSISYIPNGFTSITPYFICSNAPAFIEFITAAFGAEHFQTTVDQGIIRHFCYRAFGSMIEGSQATAEFQETKMSIHLYVPDCDDVFQKAIAGGGKSIYEVSEMPYGERSGGVIDPCGNTWWIATQKVDMYPQ